MSELHRICGMCDFWIQSSDEPKFGECRRGGPVACPTVEYLDGKDDGSREATLRLNAGWPDTLWDEWCGEFVRRSKESEV